MSISIYGIQPRKISVGSMCGELSFKDPWCYVEFPFMKTRPDCWHFQESAEKSILHKLRSKPKHSTNQDEDNNFEQSSDSEEETHINNNQRATTECHIYPQTERDFIKSVLFKDYRHLIESILITLLVSKNGENWSSMELEEFYDTVFASGQSMIDNLSVSNLDSILKAINASVVPCEKMLFKNCDNKLMKCNKICKMFGLHTASKKSKQIHEMETLTNLCIKRIKADVTPNVL